MKERPILMQGAMVRALLDGTKTQTRRLCKPMNTWVQQDCREVRMVDGQPLHFLIGAESPIEKLRSPYGQPGDRLWVRETYGDAGCRLTYRADLDDGAHCKVEKWTPSIHMFRADSRVLLEIVSVSVERLLDISEADAKAEGCHQVGVETGQVDANSYPIEFGSYVLGYRELWESINGAGSWDANPWVWVVEFKRVTP
jgi:hypothetical protein